MTVPTVFVSLIGVDTLSARIKSQATRKKLALEVAFVLDNSGPMFYTGAGANGTRQRMQFLKDAATCATNILFYDAVETTSVKSRHPGVPASGQRLRMRSVRSCSPCLSMWRQQCQCRLD
ncbi:MAG: hypothetical protein MO852_02205 [Candidatus Devosia euplotis]|nr:hypothetical protein [Candidatus Devosia euplotis]